MNLSVYASLGCTCFSIYVCICDLPGFFASIIIISFAFLLMLLTPSMADEPWQSGKSCSWLCINSLPFQSDLDWSFFHFFGTLIALHDHVPECITSHGIVQFAIRHNIPAVSSWALLDGSALGPFLPRVNMQCILLCVCCIWMKYLVLLDWSFSVKISSTHQVPFINLLPEQLLSWYSCTAYVSCVEHY